MDDRPDEPRCETCARNIEACSFCDDEGCVAPLCYRCVAAALGKLTPHPHDHGG